MNKEIIQESLKAVKYPGFSRDIVSFGLVRAIECDDHGNVTIEVAITTNDPHVPATLKEAIEKRLSMLDGIGAVIVNIVVSEVKNQPSKGNAEGGSKPKTLQKVRFTVAIASGKGG